jgi:hypothetical protein
VDSSYQQEQMGAGRVRFTVTPASAPKASGAPTVLAGIFVLVVFATISRGDNSFTFLLRVAVAVFGAIWIHRAVNRWFASKVDKVRAPGGSFVVSPTGIESNGTAIGREQLHRLILRNGVPDVSEEVVVNTGTVYSGMAAGAANDRAANRAKAARVSYMLCAEHGGRSTTLAGGMTEVTASGLLTDVSKTLTPSAN